METSRYSPRASIARSPVTMSCAFAARAHSTIRLSGSSASTVGDSAGSTTSPRLERKTAARAVSSASRARSEGREIVFLTAAVIVGAPDVGMKPSYQAPRPPERLPGCSGPCRSRPLLPSPGFAPSVRAPAPRDGAGASWTFRTGLEDGTLRCAGVVRGNGVAGPVRQRAGGSRR